MASSRQWRSLRCGGPDSCASATGGTATGVASRLRADPALMPPAVDELMRWCGPALLSIPRHARTDVELHGGLVRRGERITAAVAAANRDPRAFAEPDRLDVGRPAGTAGHLGFSHGPHFCLGASLARVQTEVAITALSAGSPIWRRPSRSRMYVPPIRAPGD